MEALDKNGNRLTIDTYVLVDEPTMNDIHSHSFQGWVKEITENTVIIEDGDCDCFELDFHQVEIVK